MTPDALLRQWLESRLQGQALQWLDQAIERTRRSNRDADLYLAYSLVPRQTGKAALALSGDELQAATRARPGWQPAGWRVDEAARLLLLLVTGADDEVLARRIEQLCTTADMNELATLYRGLPLYPQPERYRLRAAEGIRTNMRAVFEAVVHRNPYPMEQLPQAAWNQMVLKALFVGSTLDPIVGLDQHANADLARMLCDYAHERWSAGRPVSPELWRCVGPFATGTMLADLGRVLDQGTDVEQAAAMLALSRSPDPQAALLMKTRPSLSGTVARGELSWQTLAVGTQS
jgi:hypothetical protein